MVTLALYYIVVISITFGNRGNGVVVAVVFCCNYFSGWFVRKFNIFNPNKRGQG